MIVVHLDCNHKQLLIAHHPNQLWWGEAPDGIDPLECKHRWRIDAPAASSKWPVAAVGRMLELAVWPSPPTPQRALVNSKPFLCVRVRSKSVQKWSKLRPKSVERPTLSSWRCFSRAFSIESSRPPNKCSGPCAAAASSPLPAPSAITTNLSFNIHQIAIAWQRRQAVVRVACVNVPLFTQASRSVSHTRCNHRLVTQARPCSIKQWWRLCVLQVTVIAMAPPGSLLSNAARRLEPFEHTVFSTTNMMETNDELCVSGLSYIERFSEAPRI